MDITRYTDALNQFVTQAGEVKSTLDPATVFSIGSWDITQYTLWMLVILALAVVMVLVGARKLELVPKRKFTGILEFGYIFIKEGVARDVIGEGFKKHVPFLMTLFFFILTCNIVGLIPGAKAATGTRSITWALSVISFVYFNFYGIKQLGLWGYVKSICPSAVPGPMKPVIWVLETFSLILRVLTLAVRLYGNMLSGHMILGVFSIATTAFVQWAVLQGVYVDLVGALLWFVLLVAMYALETLVAFLQAYVFTILSSSYIGMAIHPH